MEVETSMMWLVVPNESDGTDSVDISSELFPGRFALDVLTEEIEDYPKLLLTYSHSGLTILTRVHKSVRTKYSWGNFLSTFQREVDDLQGFANRLALG